MGIRSSGSQVVFGDVRVPAENHLGAEGEGFKITITSLDISRPIVAVAAVGIAQAAYRVLFNYAK